MKRLEPSEKNLRLLHNISWVSGVFSAILCVLISINFLQTKRADPLNTQTMNVLIERLKANPGDDQLRTEIRELDLLARKAFFTSQWQVRTGGMLLFFNVVVVILCFQIVDYLKKKIPDHPPENMGSLWEKRKISRNWVAWSGFFIVALVLFLAFLSHQDLEKKLGNATRIQGIRGENFPKIKANQKNPGNQGSDNSAENMDLAKKTKKGTQASEPGNIPAVQGNFGTWPAFRGPGGNGISYQKNIPVSWDGKSGKNIRWKTEIPLPGYNSPVIWKDKLFLSGANDSRKEVYCIDVNSGKILWTARVEKIPGSPSQPPKVNRETGFCAPTMTTDGRRVYAIFANGDIIALDFEGKKIWDKNLGLPKNHYGHSSSLIMYQDNVIVQYDQTGNAFVLALSGKTGEEIWRTARNVRVSWASPVLVNTGKRMELLLAADPFIASYDPSTGKELWEMECISGEVGPSVAYADGVVFSVNEYAKLAAIQVGVPPKQLWEDNEYLSDVPSPVATDNYLFLVTSSGTVVCYDSKTGKKYWEKEFGVQVYSSPILAEGKIYLISSKGTMYIFKAEKTFSLIGQPQVGEGSFCTPAFLEGMIFIRGNNNLYCIGK